MIFKIKSKELKKKEEQKWHEFFCIKPRRIDDKNIVWLQLVMRKRRNSVALMYDYKFIHEYVAEKLIGKPKKVEEEIKTIKDRNPQSDRIKINIQRAMNEYLGV